MSFTTDVKNELCKIPFHNKCCQASELYGFMLYAGQFGTDRIKMSSDNVNVRRRFMNLIKKETGFPYPAEDNGAAVTVEDGKVIRKIYDIFGYEYKSSSLHLNRAVIEEECCKSSFLRGAFLASGYISEPEKSYHLELVTTHYNVAGEILLLLDEMELSAKLINRRGNNVIYYKDSEMIEKFLMELGAGGGAMELMLKKVEKTLRNDINRKVNCETSNLAKTADAAARQIEAIELLKKRGTFDSLPKSLKDVAELRLQNPEMTLNELAAMCNPPISKPGLSGRMRKIIQLSKEV